MSPAVAALVSEVKQHLERHPSQAFRAVPLAKAIGEKDVRRVRQAITVLKDKGEVVTCIVYRGDEAADEEVRLSAAPIQVPIQPRVRRFPEALHRDSQRPIPPPPPIPPTPERKRSTPGWPGESKSSPAPAQPVAPDVPASDEIPACIRRRRDPVSHLGPRQRSIVEMIELKNQAMTVTELHKALNAAGDMVGENPVATAVGLLAASGTVVACGKRRPIPGGRPAQTYATPAIAERLEKELEAAITAVPRAAIEAAPEKTVQAPAPLTINITAEAPAFDAAATDEGNSKRMALERLEAHFRAAHADGNWHGLVWLVRVAGGDVPATLEILATWQRAGQIAYSVADRAPIWRAVEGRW